MSTRWRDLRELEPLNPRINCACSLCFKKATHKFTFCQNTTIQTRYYCDGHAHKAAAKYRIPFDWKTKVR